MKQMMTIMTTAIASAGLTSLFWLVAFNNGNDGERKQLVEVGRVAASVKIGVPIVVGPSGMAVPVSGVSASALIDTFKQARAGGARVHDAIDIMAPSGTPVLAAAAGRVEKLYFSKGGGGVSAYIRSADQHWNYYYAHLQGYAPGLAEGQTVQRGQPIGRVGFSGNGNPAAPHLHFAVNRMAAGEKWYDGEAVNPYPLLAGQ